MLCQKKNEKKKVNPASQNGGNENFFLKKKLSNHVACDGWTRVTHTFNPAIWNGGNEEKDKKKKNESGSFWKYFFKGVRLEIFFANRVRKKKNSWIVSQ